MIDQLKSVLVLFLISVFSVSCTSTTMVRSSDPEVMISIDGRWKGKGSVLYRDRKIFASSTYVRMQKPGCEPRMYFFSRSEEFEVTACILGIFFIFPLLWMMKYEPEHSYDYSCTKLNAGFL